MRTFVIACLVTFLPAVTLATDLDRTLRVQGRLYTSGGQPASGDLQLTLGL